MKRDPSQASRLASKALAKRATLVSLLVLLGACAQRPITPTLEHEGQVNVSLLPPASEGQTVLKPGQSAAGGQVIEDAVVMPLYPTRWIEQVLPDLSISALVVVDESGQAAAITLDTQTAVDACGACADDFAAAVDAALRRWKFAPLEVSDWVDGPDLDGDGSPDTVARAIVDTQRYSLRLRFDFAIRAGRPQVLRGG